MRGKQKRDNGFGMRQVVVFFRLRCQLRWANVNRSGLSRGLHYYVLCSLDEQCGWKIHHDFHYRGREVAHALNVWTVPTGEAIVAGLGLEKQG